MLSLFFFYRRPKGIAAEKKKESIIGARKSEMKRNVPSLSLPRSLPFSIIILFSFSFAFYPFAPISYRWRSFWRLKGSDKRLRAQRKKAIKEKGNYDWKGGY